ncbi:DUF3152 domain-containing protein [Streptomyces bambusae]|uniref:DUF3152 domain-containing protein n=1 Tax=Streptomyces bambusae TaxID=1550616 RepID=UPI001CFE5939|nr:DUF3152 domain-containing protein [Streptomyces bambusae]MCB5163518.1 DUF3152 domain-containing protein [Streptomyces bambusae]
MGKRGAGRGTGRGGKRRGGPGRGARPVRLTLLGKGTLGLGGLGLVVIGAAALNAPADRGPTPPPAAADRPARGYGASPQEALTASAEPRTTESARAARSVPRTGPGTFTAARAAGDATGNGPLRSYAVEVEDGSGLDADRAAAEIRTILAHERSWAAHGRAAFRLVGTDGQPDFTIKIATADTADRLCAAENMDTGGELNCETSFGVVVNLKRWLTGSPKFDGPPAEYRHLIINHEVGHEIGIRRHLGCPGPGRPAPAMMQQIKGLDGCRSNAWPYDAQGSYLDGPEAP